MEIITLEKSAFYTLLRSAVEELEQHFGKEEPWIDTQEAMQILNVKSMSTMQKLRDHDAITFSQPQKKIILYYKPSLYAYLAAHSNKTITL